MKYVVKIISSVTLCVSGRGEPGLSGARCSREASRLGPYGHLHCQRGVGRLQPLLRHHQRFQKGILHHHDCAGLCLHEASF